MATRCAGGARMRAGPPEKHRARRPGAARATGMTNERETDMSSQATNEVATLGGGCFWCQEAVFLDVDGVTAVESGYAGGRTRNPGYRDVCDGDTGHAEVVNVTFDPSRIGYREILEIFFATHDPTQLNRQGNDVGTQYRSAIFTHSDAQRDTALDLIRTLERDKLYDDPIVTQVEPLNGNYWPAEAYHQNYYARNPGQGYCVVVIGPKLAKFRRKFAHRLKSRGA
ncbi:Peptide methionine sulfoxide reductase MsrA [Burkholderia oklahomensis]|nr:Peptide methionine sulfoxide reductase MsrA [Burkholderia oklahomensis]